MMRIRTIPALLFVVAGIALAAPAASLAVPIKLIPDGQIGSNVGGSGPGEFIFPEGVAVSPAGTLYVTDQGNHRVQELTSSGEFVLMFGWDVNATKDVEPGGTQAEKNVCTVASKDTCKAGVAGDEAGQFTAAESVTVDPASGNVYVAEQSYHRVQEFTSAGRFVLEIGHDVNKTTQRNLCTEEEVEKAGVTCGAATETTSAEHGSLNMEAGGDLLAMGGPEDLLYAGEADRVQEFHANGEWAGEINLTGVSGVPSGSVGALALDSATGDVYLTYASAGESSVVREFDAADQELKKFEVEPRESLSAISIHGLALDGEGHLVVTAFGQLPLSGEGRLGFGVLYSATTGRPITTFVLPNRETAGEINEIAPFSASGVMFDAAGELFTAGGAPAGETEVLRFRPVNVAELSATPVVCASGGERETDLLLNCALNGEANPEGVTETSVWFEWGRSTLLGERTSTQGVSVVGAVNGTLEGLRPNETFYDRLAGEDANVKAPETLTSETLSFSTPLVAPVIVGEPGVSFVGPFSAVLLGELNPENAHARYMFRYAPVCEADAVCPAIEQAPGAGQTTTLESSVYGRIAATLEAKGLEPSTGYRYQLFAESENDEGTEKLSAVPGAEGTFTTAPAPVPSVATDTASAVTATSATISGSVDPDGQPATYAFELGIYEGAATSFGIVYSGSAGTGGALTARTLGLSGLQPGTTYAYRISVKSGFTPGHEALTGETMLFTTLGLPAVLGVATPPTMLAVPPASFPKTQASGPGKGKSGGKAKKRRHRSKRHKPSPSKSRHKR
jgi:DNA-binding beta-propeller fold protein YncE